MTTNYRDAYILGLVHELRSLPHETEWVEFKVNHRNPHAIGQYISALANAVALIGKPHAYMVWGIENETQTIVGTDFVPGLAKKGNEPLETWLRRLLTPDVDFRFHEVAVDERPVLLLEVGPAAHRPVAFESIEYIRVGSTTRKLKNYPEKERMLWRAFDRQVFEDGIAAERESGADVLRKLDSPAYFDLLARPLPDGHAAILDALQDDRLIAPCEAGGFDITNLGAMLFARNLDDFPGLKRKAVRVIQYRGPGRTETLKEQPWATGYACGFERMIAYVNGLLPANEVVHQALRREVPMFPEIAVRELVANALIHQDFFATGTGPMVEIFDDRIEIPNPGKPLVDPQRFLDTPPQSRNEALASLLRRAGICEERGSGIDKVVFQVELYQLPAPLFEASQGFTRAVLFSHKTVAEMDRRERVRACYLHACLKCVTSSFLTNTSLRERFGIKQENRASVSRYIREAVNAGEIKPFDEHAGKRMMKYVPFWA